MTWEFTQRSDHFTVTRSSCFCLRIWIDIGLLCLSQYITLCILNMHLMNNVWISRFWGIYVQIEDIHNL